ncbi:MAG: thiol oxidoreductase [Rhodobacterales bacterium]|nr:thiol oxidoreductase [Rhodobacterales bacterium]
MRLTLLAALLALPAQADPLDDRHLPVIPRTAEESARIAALLGAPQEFTAPDPYESLPGGAATTRARAAADARSQHSANMPFDRAMDFKVGNGLFRKLWVAAPASTLASDGLGPLFNARGCQNCHIKDGRGHAPEGPDDSRVSMVLRLSVPGGTTPDRIEDWIATRPEPTHGEQLQDLSVPGLAAEGQVQIDWDEQPVTLADGTTVTLRRPRVAVAGPAQGALHPDTMLSPRVAPQMIGLGLIEAIPAADILAHADPEDADGDGISGRPNILPSVEHGVPMLGRFGHKAGMATLREQSAAAFAIDMGLSNPLFPDPHGDCTPARAECRAAPVGQNPGQRDGLEVDAASLDLVTFYARNLAVPERRGADDPRLLAGKAVFHGAGCPACHVPRFVTHRLDGQPEQSFQLIWPHTDLLLHDMGEGLADHRPEGRATGREWRTAPLWGIGLARTVSPEAGFLHDGRARTLIEAILWHGGEAQAARDSVIALPAADRAALIEYLQSL